MKVRLVVTFGLVLVGAAVLSQIGSMWRPSRDAGPSGLAFDAVSANLGVVKDRYAPVRFRFTNQSSVPLTISRVVPECGCTSFVLSPSETLAPGQTGTLDVRVDTDSMRGEVSKRVVMHLADPRQPPLTLTIYLKKPFVFVSPGDEIQISHVGFDRPVLGKEIRLSNMGFSAFAFKGWKSPSKRVSVVPVAAARGTAAFQDLRVIVDSSSYGAGRFDEPLTLMAETDGQPWEQDVNVHVNIAPPLQIEPAGILFGRLSPEQIRAGTAQYACEITLAPGYKELDVRAAACEHRDVKLRVMPVLAGSRYIIVAEVAVRGTHGRIATTADVELVCNKGEQAFERTVQIPVAAYW